MVQLVRTLVESKIITTEEAFQVLVWYHWLHGWVAWTLAHPTLLIAGGVIFLMSCVGIGYIRRQLTAPETPPEESYGTARFATTREILASPKFNDIGIPVGQIGSTILRLPSEQNVLVVGPKGVGKSRRLMIPAMDWPGSVICIDSSREILHATAQMRKAYGPVYVLDFTNPRGDHYNPFDQIRWNEWDEVADCQRVIEHLTYVDSRVIQRDAGTFYRPWANLLHLTSALYLHHTNQPLSPAHLRAFYQVGSRNFLRVLNEMAEFDHDEIHKGAISIRENTEQIRTGIWSSALMSLLPWMDKKLAAVTNDTTIPIESIQQAWYPSTIYLCVSPEDLHGRLNGPTRATIDQWSMRLCDRKPDAYRQEVLWEVADMTMLGHLEMLRDTPAHLRKYGHRTLYECQSFGQIFDVFGQNAGGILTNCTTWVMFRPMERREANLMADKLDNKTVTQIVERWTYHGSDSTRSVAAQSHSRALMTPDEIMRLGGDEDGWTIVCVEGQRPALLRNPPDGEGR